MNQCQPEQKSGVSHSATTTMTTEDIWASSPSSFASSFAINPSLPLLRLPLTSKDISALKLPEHLEELSNLSLTPRDLDEFTLRSLEEPESKPVTTAPSPSPEILTPASAIARLETLTEYLRCVDKVLVTTSDLLSQLSGMVPPCPSLPQPTRKRLSSSIVDSVPLNPLFMHSPEYATKEAYFSHHGCAGTTDQLAPERLVLSLKRLAKNPSIPSHQATPGSMDTTAKKLSF
ncbi:MAG: hypothetical protein [Circoviridae sp.]|nr:MAG: hypothetical protein [Circoviridae sp.]